MTETPGAPAPPSLLRVLGPIFGLAVVVGGMIGSGIMRAPGLVAEGLPSTPAILIAWVLGGVASMLTAMPLVEAGASVPLAGGPFPIAERAFGRGVGFFAGWIGWLSYAAGVAFVAAVFGEYVHRLGMLPGLSSNLLACVLIVALAGVNWTGTRVSGHSQSIGSALKAAVFLILVGVLFLTPRAPSPAIPAHAVAAVAGLGGAAMAIRLIYQTYAGWDAAIYFSEEVHRPGEQIARSTFLGIGLVTVIYVLVNAAVLHVLSPAQIAHSALAVGEAAKVGLGPYADTVITGMGLLSLAAIVNLMTMVPPRITFRMARHGSLPTAFGRVAVNGTPRIGLIAATALSVVLAATGGYERIVRIYSPWTMGVILIVCLSAIRLRYAEPDLPRPWRMPLFPWLAIFACLVQVALLVLVMVDDPKSAALSVIVAVAPLPLFYGLQRRWRAGAARAFGPAML
jgi:APA family basic amino acid/polyamine antiporter